jgi:hypothetical protein
MIRRVYSLPDAASLRFSHATVEIDLARVSGDRHGQLNHQHPVRSVRPKGRAPRLSGRCSRPSTRETYPVSSTSPMPPPIACLHPPHASPTMAHTNTMAQHTHHGTYTHHGTHAPAHTSTRVSHATRHRSPAQVHKRSEAKSSQTRHGVYQVLPHAGPHTHVLTELLRRIVRCITACAHHHHSHSQPALYKPHCHHGLRRTGLRPGLSPALSPGLSSALSPPATPPPLWPLPL